MGEENNKPVGFFSERHFVLRVYFDIKAKQKTSQSSTWSSSSPSSSSLLSFFFSFFSSLHRFLFFLSLPSTLFIGIGSRKRP